MRSVESVLSECVESVFSKRVAVSVLRVCVDRVCERSITWSW